jgi:hypothetical protein
MPDYNCGLNCSRIVAGTSERSAELLQSLLSALRRPQTGPAVRTSRRFSRGLPAPRPTSEALRAAEYSERAENQHCYEGTHPEITRFRCDCLAERGRFEPPRPFPTSRCKILREFGPVFRPQISNSAAEICSPMFRPPFELSVPDKFLPTQEEWQMSLRIDRKQKFESACLWRIPTHAVAGV